jgi:hypothetical protein
MGNNGLSRPAIRHMNDATSVERIQAWYEQGEPNTVVLTEWEIKKKDRLKAVFMLLTRDRDARFIVKYLMRQFGITEPTCYQDIKDARLLFGNIEKTSKQADRVIMLSKIRRAARKAWKDKDLKAYQKFLDMEVKVLGLDRDEPDMPDFEALKANTYLIGYFPEITGMPTVEDVESIAKKFLSNKVTAEDAQIVEDGTDSAGSEEDPLQ